MDSALKASSLLQLSPDWQSASCRGCCIVVGSKDLKVEIREIVEFGMYSAGQEGLFEDVTASAGFQGLAESECSLQLFDYFGYLRIFL